jgi:hypothetical protein
VEIDVLVVGGAKCSSTDSLGEFLPRELIVEDRPLLWAKLRVGEDCPDCLELGRNSAVAGDAADFESIATAWFWGGGVVTPFLVRVLDGVGVSDRSGAADIGTAGVELEAVESSVKEGLLLGWR